MSDTEATKADEHEYTREEWLIAEVERLQALADHLQAQLATARSLMRWWRSQQ